MTYSLEFHPDALKEWQNLPNSIKEQFKKIFLRRLQNPHIPKAKLRGKLKDCYKIKLLKVVYRLVHHVKDQALVVTVVAVGKRVDNFVYNLALKR